MEENIVLMADLYVKLHKKFYLNLIFGWHTRFNFQKKVEIIVRCIKKLY